MQIIPQVFEQINNYERHYDIFSLLLKERIIMLSGEIDDNLATIIISQLLYLSSVDKNKDIYLYINSCGGSVSSGLAIYDTMNYIPNDVVTLCVGLSASMAALLLSSGAKGKRYALPTSEIMIHQPLGNAQGKCDDVEIISKRLLKTKNKLNEILAKNTKKNIKEIEEHTKSDYFMDANEALNFNLIDKIIESKKGV